MNDEVLKDILSELLKEQRLITKNLTELSVKVNSKEPEKNEKPASPKPNVVSLSDQSIRLLRTEFESCASKIKSLTEKIPTDVKINKTEERNLVLFSQKYEEGHYGLKELLRWIFILVITSVLIYSAIKYLPTFYEGRSENKAYRNALLWYYYQSPKQGKKNIQNVIRKFHQGDTTAMNQLNRFIAEESYNTK